MDLWEQMKEDNNSNFYTPSKRDKIYNEYLVPLKARISRILSYNLKQYLLFMQEYDEIIRKEDMETILKDISNLELKIGNYEQNEGKEESFEERSIIAINQLDKLLEKSEQLDIKDFEREFLDIKQIYNKNSGSYRYADREVIEQKIATIHSKMIIRKVRDNVIDLYNDISEQDVERLSIEINNQIFILMQSKNLAIQEILNEINYKMIDRVDAVYDVEIWRLIDLAQRGQTKGIEQKSRQQGSNQNYSEQQELERKPSYTTLVLQPKQRRNFNLPNLNKLFQRTLRIGKQRMMIDDTVELGNKKVKAKELRKIDMNWLAEKIPESMLEEIEERKLLIELNREERNKLKKRYSTDRKIPIYDFVKDSETSSKTKKDRFFDFEDEEGNVITCFQKSYSNGIQLKIGSRDLWSEIDMSEYRKSIIIKVREYANFIDRVLDANLSEQLDSELGNFFKKVCIADARKENQREIKELMRKLPIFANLCFSYENLEEYAERTGVDFKAQEEIRRNRFYRDNKFKNEIRVDENREDKDLYKMERAIVEEVRERARKRRQTKDIDIDRNDMQQEE
ncbi:MAG: hypothetical protein HFJ48_01875 [Clostridia bacterium]|nr:hypothetical protein [Clostridia bacterium]